MRAGKRLRTASVFAATVLLTLIVISTAQAKDEYARRT